MEERVVQELELLRKYYPNIEYKEEGRWVRIPSYPLPEGWNRSTTDVAFQIKPGHPGTPPYGFCVPVGLEYQGHRPESYKDSASPHPPFEGRWGIFSWAHTEQWRPTANVTTGSNLLNWARSFADRFREGR